MNKRKITFFISLLFCLCVVSVVADAGVPAARQGDMTSHGGTVITGSPNVLINGKPAARVDDMVSCPMVTPGTPPIPHVGGPITIGGSSATVLINNKPAARTGALVTEVGPPSSLVGGSATVLIGP